MGKNVNVILGSLGECCLCSDTPHCGDCKGGDNPPDPGEDCNCNDYGAYYNVTNCFGKCLKGCEDCIQAFDCPTPPGQGCYQCVPVCSCEASGEFPPGTDCVGLGFDGSEPASGDCGECPSIPCTHCFCYPCSEYGLVECTGCAENCDSGECEEVPPAPGAQCPAVFEGGGCCQCTGVGCGVCDQIGETPPCACCPSETGGACPGCGICCCPTNEEPVLDEQGSCICVPA